MNKNIRRGLIRSIERSQAAYELYKAEKKYYQALRIKKANIRVYELLESFLLECQENEISVIQNYLFHLDDWFHQFVELEKSNLSLESEFIFERFDSSPSFPRDIIETIKTKLK